MTRSGLNDCRIEDAHRLYDAQRCELLGIDGWDGSDVSVTTPDGASILIEGALESDRYSPVRIANLSE